MRKITARISNAFEMRRSLKIDNSETDGTSLWLFGNKIAQWHSSGLWVTNAGWKSKTTKERLNGLTGVQVRSIRGEWYLNDVQWDGSWVNVDDVRSVGNTIEEEVDAVEFDITNEWLKKERYSKPVYSVFHTNTELELDAVEFKLQSAGIQSRRMESDTAGIYKPNYFVVVRPEDFDNSLIIIK
jgi:hypothetical protein